MPRLSSCLLALCFATLLPTLAQITAQVSTPSAPEYQTNPKYLAAIVEAKKCTAQHQFTFAEDAYKKANKIAGGQDSKSLHAIFDLQLSMGEYKDAAATAAQLETLAVSPTEKAAAEVNRGQALFL
jgi:hypothetical protein